MSDYVTLQDASQHLASHAFEILVTGLGTDKLELSSTLTGGTSGTEAIVHRAMSTITGIHAYEIGFPDGPWDLGETVDDGTSSGTIQAAENNVLQDIIDRSEAWLHGLTNNIWGTTSATREEVFKTKRRQDTIVLGRRPVTAISSMHVNGEEWTDIVDGSDYWLDKKNGKISVLPGRWNPTIPRKNVEIDYTWGNATVPDLVKQVVLAYTRWQWELWNGHKQTRGADIRVSDFSVVYQAPEEVPRRIIQMATPLIHSRIR